MGFVGVALGAGASIWLWQLGHPISAAIGGLLALICLWSWGVMHNYATESAKRRADYTGAFFDLSERDVAAVPDWLVTVNMLATLGAVAMLVIAAVMHVF